MDAMAQNFNSQVNKLGMGNLPRFEVPQALNINTYLTPDQQRGLLGGALILAGLAATSVYIADGCSFGSSGKEDDKAEGTAVGSFKDQAKENAREGKLSMSSSDEVVETPTDGFSKPDDKEGAG